MLRRLSDDGQVNLIERPPKKGKSERRTLAPISDLKLDDTEISMLRLMCIGLSDEAVARRLRVSHRTVQRRAQQLMAKLSVPNRFALGARAQQLGLLGSLAPEPAQPAPLTEKTLWNCRMNKEHP